MSLARAFFHHGDSTRFCCFPIPSSALNADRGQAYSPHCNPPSQGILCQCSLCPLYQPVVAGGGANGFLGIVMAAAPYLLRAGEPFLPPKHPSTQPPHIATATQSLITAANRLFDTSLDAFHRYSQIREILRQQILTAIDPSYYNVLEDATFGYAEITVMNLLAHLESTYATLSADDLELNRMRFLADAWTPEEPIEHLWICIKHLRAIADAGGAEPLSDSTVMRLTLSALEQAGVYSHSIQTWRDCAEMDHTWVNFCPHFMHADVESDASYLSEMRGRSRAAGIHILSCKPLSPPCFTTSIPPLNGAIYVHCQILKEVVSSAAEAELAALFHNSKEAYAIRNILAELGHPQPSTHIVTNNSTASGIANDTIQQKHSKKAIDMRYYWVLDWFRQGQFPVYWWEKGSLNRADYFTKHHPASHHMLMRPHYLHCPPSLPSSPPDYYACLASNAAIISTPVPVLLPESAGEVVLKSAYDVPYMRRTNHIGAATRLGTCVSANNDGLETAIE